MRRRWRAVRTAAGAIAGWSRDILVIAAIGCVAIGLSFWSAALSWIAVGAFLFVVGTSGRRGPAG